MISNRSFGQAVDAIAARGARDDVHDRQTEFVHRDRAERARHGAVAESEAAPRAAFAAPGDRGRRAARREPAILGLLHGDVASAGAEKPSDTFVRLARVHAEVARNGGGAALVDHVASGGFRLAGDDLLGESATAWKAARPAVRSRQHRRHDVDSRIFPDSQLPVRERDECGEDQPHATEDLDRPDHRVQHQRSLMTTTRPIR